MLLLLLLMVVVVVVVVVFLLPVVLLVVVVPLISWVRSSRACASAWLTRSIREFRAKTGVPINSNFDPSERLLTGTIQRRSSIFF